MYIRDVVEVFEKCFRRVLDVVLDLIEMFVVRSCKLFKGLRVKLSEVEKRKGGFLKSNVLNE